ncbi:hypothetical protein EDB89DRAFT_1908591 [Lactarius sanguifluus]|nr:hypothetical protein EDB89DRAFT_1908591 [Lactarius sanguifluus]
MTRVRSPKSIDRRDPSGPNEPQSVTAAVLLKRPQTNARTVRFQRPQAIGMHVDPRGTLSGPREGGVTGPVAQGESSGSTSGTGTVVNNYSQLSDNPYPLGIGPGLWGIEVYGVP